MGGTLAPVLLGLRRLDFCHAGSSMRAIAAFATRTFDVLMVALVFTVMT
jgi:hypothetical protein